jgi:coproporphyrinogen III oxidase-like Fe-S oxidoreductase
VQSFDPAALAFLGREHSAAQAIAAIELAQKIFPRLSFDLIYARPGQGEAAWRAELRQALMLAADHLSLYQLTIEPGTKFATLYGRGEFSLPEEDAAAALYDATAEEAARFGLKGYEISNYAMPGGESRHNLAYWRYQDYAGIGPGAHGRLTLGQKLIATSRHRGPEAWAELVERDGSGATQEEAIAPRDRAREALLMGLRLATGVSLGDFAARTGVAPSDAVDPNILAACIEEGYLTSTETSLVATAEGRKRLDALLPALLR